MAAGGGWATGLKPAIVRPPPPPAHRVIQPVPPPLRPASASAAGFIDVTARLSLAMASRRAHLAPPIDGVTVDLNDLPRLESDARRARRGGFGAKLCIHPSQVSVVRQALGPTPQEMAWARRVVAAAEAAAGGVVSLDGRMVDMPVVLQARRLLALEN